MNYIPFFLIVTGLFILYAEYSVGNIVYRITSQGIQQFQPGNIIHYLLNPLYNGFLWNFQLLDVNYIFIIMCSTIIYHNIY